MTPLNLFPWRSLSHIHVLRDTWAPARRDLLSSMSLATRIKPQMLAADAPSLMISCGLALRGFDA
jgi:hypothetical protein